MCIRDRVVDRILKEFGLEHSFSHIINGHMPVKSKNGENPMKCGGKVFVIDGGFSRAYQKQTGIAGYTPVSYTHLDCADTDKTAPDGRMIDDDLSCNCK